MIKIKNLSFKYQKQDSLFDDLSLNIESGSILGLLGKNGAGKTTILNILSGLIPAKNGELSVNGYLPFQRNPDFLSDVCYVAEDFDIPQVSIGRYIKAFSPFYPNFSLSKINSILKEFELDRSLKLNKISQGQRKKFLIAFVLASNCKLLILDEPTNGLDIPSKSLFRKVLVSSIAEDQLVIISTHQVKDIDTIIDKVLILDNGKILLDKSITEINEKYFFDTVTSIKDTENILYKETAIGGYNVIKPVENSNESSIDMEVFFNAVVNNHIKQ